MRWLSLPLLMLVGIASLHAAEPPEGIQPWNGAAVTDWTNHEQPIVITDLTQAEPADAFSDDFRRGHWKVIPYEMRPDSGGYKGKAVWCGYEADPPSLTIKLNAEGWHAIFVGFLSLTGAYVKLDQDPAPLWLNNPIRDYYVNSVDTYFKAAELTKDSTLTISPKRHGSRQPAGITSIMLIPLTEAEVQRLQRDRADTSNRRLVATADGFSSICGNSPRTVEECLAEIEYYRNTDFGTLIYHGGWSGDKTIYPSRVGYLPGLELEDVCQDYHRDFIDAVRELADKGINPLKVIIEGAHEMGMKVHVGMRPGGWSYYQPFNGLWDSPFYLNNPQWRCRDHASRDSAEITRMSWAVPEVRRHIIDLLMEQVGFGADGAHIVFNRGFPMVLFEEPFCKLFRDKHGVDPNELDENDPRIVEMWSDIITLFFKELRAELDKEEARRDNGQPIEISIMVLGTHEDNYHYGLDIRRLVNEGLIDEIQIYPYGFGNVLPGSLYDEAFFKEVCEPAGVRYYPTVDPPYDVTGQLGRALELYDGGAPGLCYWDAGHVDRPTWAIQSRLGHPEEVRWRREHVNTDDYPESIRFYKWWGDQRMDVRYPPYWGG